MTDRSFGFETGSHSGLNSQPSCLSLPGAVSYRTDVSYHAQLEWPLAGVAIWSRNRVLSQSSEAKFADNAGNPKAENLRLV